VSDTVREAVRDVVSDTVNEVVREAVDFTSRQNSPDWLPARIDSVDIDPIGCRTESTESFSSNMYGRAICAGSK
jgi:hypothetical protein